MTLTRRIRLPTRQARCQRPEARPTALVIDPDEEVGELLAHTLRHHGYGVRFAADEACAIAECRRRPPDVVFLDPLLLPWARGLGLCRRLRRSSQAPVVLLSSRAQDRDVRDGLAAGAAEYIGKPFSPRDLLERLDAVLASRPSNADSRRVPLIRASLNARWIADYPARVWM